MSDILVMVDGKCIGELPALALMIAGMQAEIARLREERRWIPVVERLPEGEEWVDTAGKWGDSVGWHESSGWQNVEGDPFPSDVTHWRKRGPGPEGVA